METKDHAPRSGRRSVDDILSGAIDLHHHGYPEVALASLTRHEDTDELITCRDAGMAGLVLKSHMWPTVGRAYLLRKLVPGIEVFPSITLNTVVGGFNPIAVESAGEQGARVMFMPTWSAANDLEIGGFSVHLKNHLSRIGGLTAGEGLRVTSADGKVRTEVKECLALAAQYRMIVCTAHISPRESIALADCAKTYGIHEVVFSHPDARSVRASKEEVRDMLSLGALYEFCVNGFLPGSQRISPRQMMEIVAEAGSDHAIITTDYFNEWEPPGAEMLRMLIGTMLAVGMNSEDLQKMVNRNPRRLLGMN